MIRSSDVRGFTLIESLISVAILGLAAALVSTILLTNARVQVQGTSKMDSNTYRSELKNKFRDQIDSGVNKGKNQCRILMDGLLTGTDLYNLQNKSDPLSSDYVENYIHVITNKDFINNNPALKYGDLVINKIWLSHPSVVARGYGYKLTGGPAEIPASSVFSSTGNLYNVIVIKAELNIEFLRNNNPEDRVTMKPLHLNFAYKRSSTISEFVDCGGTSLAYSLANEYACNSLGPHFIYVTDDHNGPGTGQCYMPVFTAPCADTDYSCLQDYADADKVISKPTKFRPLRMFFCEDVAKGIRLNQKYCTGAKGV